MDLGYDWPHLRNWFALNTMELDLVWQMKLRESERCDLSL
jgi:hypothetical protein